MKNKNAKAVCRGESSYGRWPSRWLLKNIENWKRKLTWPLAEPRALWNILKLKRKIDWNGLFARWSDSWIFSRHPPLCGASLGGQNEPRSSCWSCGTKSLAFRIWIFGERVWQTDQILFSTTQRSSAHVWIFYFGSVGSLFGFCQPLRIAPLMLISWILDSLDQYTYFYTGVIHCVDTYA